MTYEEDLNALIDQKIADALASQGSGILYGTATGYEIDNGQEYRFVQLDGSSNPVLARMSRHIRASGSGNEHEARVACVKVGSHLLILAETGFQKASQPEPFEIPADLEFGWQEDPYAGQKFYRRGTAPDPNGVITFPEVGDDWNYVKNANEYRISGGGPHDVSISGASVGVAGTNFDTATMEGHYVGAFLHADMTLTRRTSAVTFLSTGDVSDVTVVTVASSYRPLKTSLVPWACGRSCGTADIDTAGVLKIRSGPSGGSIAINDVVSFQLHYPRNGSIVDGL